jgi:hypothetical protein
MQYRYFLMALVTSMVLCGCAAPAGPPPVMSPAFQRLSSQICALIRKDYPDAEIEANWGHVDASVRMAPPTTQTHGHVYITTYGPEKTGFYFEMGLQFPEIMDVPTPEDGWENYNSWGYYGYAYLAGTRQIVEIAYATGSSAPKGFHRAMNALIRHGTIPYHRPKHYHRPAKPNQIGGSVLGY